MTSVDYMMQRENELGQLRELCAMLLDTLKRVDNNLANPQAVHSFIVSIQEEVRRMEVL